jgi:hypothetical protein
MAVLIPPKVTALVGLEDLRSNQTVVMLGLRAEIIVEAQAASVQMTIHAAISTSQASPSSVEGQL